MRFIFITLLISLFIGSCLSIPKKGSVSGIVKDVEITEHLLDAKVYIEEPELGASTDINGFYRIDSIPAGMYKVTAKNIGYIDAEFDSIYVYPDSVTILKILMLPDFIYRKAIQGKAEKNHNIKNTNDRQKIIIRSLPPKFSTPKVDGRKID